MDARFLDILMKTCSESAAQSAEYICDLAKQRELDIHTLMQQFHSLLPKYRFDEISDWNDAEKVITKAYLILELRAVGQNYMPSSQCTV